MATVEESSLHYNYLNDQFPGYSNPLQFHNKYRGLSENGRYR